MYIGEIKIDFMADDIFLSYPLGAHSLLLNLILFENIIF
jgi:hypothetical protein